MDKLIIARSTVPERVNKTYFMRDGKLCKQANANVTQADAYVMPVDSAQSLARLLTKVAQNHDMVLINGAMIGATDKVPFHLVTEAKLASMLGVSAAQVPCGVHEHNGELYAARLKRGMHPSSWLLIDADDPEGMPDDMRCMSLAQRLEALEKVIPNISKVERVELRASSARVHKVGEPAGGRTHAWLRINQPEKLDVLREYLKVHSELAGLAFPSPRHSRKSGEVIGYDSRTLIDLAPICVGRLIFNAKPEVQAEGYQVADADIQIMNEGQGILDISWLDIPTQSDLESYRQKTGLELELTRDQGAYQVVVKGQLRPDTPIEIQGVERPLHERVNAMADGDKLRCETPFRASQSEAAFIRKTMSGDVFLYDVGTHTQYPLIDPPSEFEQPRNAVVSDIFEGICLTDIGKLLEKQFQETVWLVANLLPIPNLAIVGGPPKVGKSWFCALLAISIAEAGHETIYLANEDSEKRLQKRFKALGAERGIHFISGLDSDRALPKGAEAHSFIRALKNRLPNTACIIVDTMAAIRATPPSRTKKDDYALAEEEFSALRKLAHELNIAIIVVHHTRKATEHDASPVERLLGSQGIGATAETIMVMQPKGVDLDVKLHITGKDVEQQDLIMKWQSPGFSWPEDMAEAELGDFQRKCLERMRAFPCTQKDIESELGADKGQISKAVAKLRRSGLAEKDQEGLWHAVSK